jgi:hypothetical protein
MFNNNNSSSRNNNNDNNINNNNSKNIGTPINNSFAAVSLERKLELLESRFTTPAMAPLNTFASPSGEQPPPATTSRGGGDLNLDHSSSPSTLGGGGGGGSSSSHSEHSFSFSTPMSRTASNGALSNLSSASNLPFSSVRSKRRASLNTSFHAVSMATTRHLRKLASQQQQQQQQQHQLQQPFHNHNSNSNASLHSSSRTNTSLPSSLLVLEDANRSFSGLPSSSNSRASSRSASNQTLLTSHVRTHKHHHNNNNNTSSSNSHNRGAISQPPQRSQPSTAAPGPPQEQHQQQQQVVVAESPPVFVTPHGPTSVGMGKMDPAKPAAARNLVMTLAGHPIVAATPVRCCTTHTSFVSNVYGLTLGRLQFSCLILFFCF